MTRLKIFAAVLVCIVGLVGILYAVSQTVLLQSFQSIENRQSERNISRIEAAFANHSNALNVKLRDWARWDDTYQFIQDRNTEYADSNLADESLINLEINLMTFIDLGGEVVYTKYVNLETGESEPAEELTKQLILKKGVLATDENGGASGIVHIGEKTMLVESLPILRSDGSGPVTGTMIFGRSIDETLINNFEELSQLSIDAFLGNETLPLDVQNARGSLATHPSFITTLSKDEIAGYFTLHDLSNDPVGIIRTISPREITNQGSRTVQIFMLVSSLAILLVGLIVLFLFEHFFLRRFAQLSREMTEISFTDLRHAAVHVGKKDEVGVLAQKINALFAELARYQQKEEEEIARQKQQNQADQESNETLRKSLEEKASMNKLMVERELKMIELKQEIKHLQEALQKATHHT